MLTELPAINKDAQISRMRTWKGRSCLRSRSDDLLIGPESDNVSIPHQGSVVSVLVMSVLSHTMHTAPYRALTQTYRLVLSAILQLLTLLQCT